MAYVSQELLTEDAPLILDVTCSFLKHWPRFATIRMDVRAECSPDIVADARYLPFREGVVDEIYCDPPHFVRRGNNAKWFGHDMKWLETIKRKRKLSGRVTPDEFTRYGWWRSKKEWYEFVRATASEFYRVLREEGKLHYKMTETRDKRDPRREDLATYAISMEQVSERVTPSRSNRHGGKDPNKVFWPVFVKTTP